MHGNLPMPASIRPRIYFKTELKYELLSFNKFLFRRIFVARGQEGLEGFDFSRTFLFTRAIVNFS